MLTAVFNRTVLCSIDRFQLRRPHISHRNMRTFYRNLCQPTPSSRIRAGWCHTHLRGNRSCRALHTPSAERKMHSRSSRSAHSPLRRQAQLPLPFPESADEVALPLQLALRLSCS